jgi:flagellar biogenesis protein FliO
MVDSDLAFILIPLVPALAFMLWVIWGLEKQIRSGRRHRDAITRPKG